ncbi:M42 family metallopeptidase [Psychrobacillus sp. NPDC058041]|uniref:M42 family metallopeptidase n=1 Tax=Psychrobacillus sp. NPDC058041 TaxID=3346310 RepID=UPI0036DCEA28
MTSLKRYLKELNDLVAVSGEEDEVADYIKRELENTSLLKTEDSLGNLIYIKKGQNARISLLLAAHMDEIGFIVTYIDNDGFVYFGPIGDHDDRMAINQVLQIKTQKGIVKGVTGTKPAHVLTSSDIQKAIMMKDIFLDVGTSSKKETENLGVEIGDYITFDREGQFLNDGPIFTGKAVDNRSGCAILIEVMKRIEQLDIQPTVYGSATVQEETGIRGAAPVGYTVQPTIALAIDVTLAGGLPGHEKQELPVYLGKGAAIKFYDEGISVPKKLSRKLVETAKKYNIPYQREVLLKGATDARAISVSGNGVITGAISIPSKYIHSGVGCVHIEDIENVVELIVRFIEEFTENL